MSFITSNVKKSNSKASPQENMGLLTFSGKELVAQCSPEITSLETG